MNIRIGILFSLLSLICNESTEISKVEKTAVDYVGLSAEMIESLEVDRNVDFIIEKFAKTIRKDLYAQLDTDDKKLAFWINIYNGYILATLKGNPELYDDRSRFFKQKRIRIGGELLSFANIEHGIIRRSQKALGLGYFTKWFPPNYEKAFRPDKRDHRVHFALNCGAKSCPPVTAFRSNTLNQQLNKLQTSYLAKVTSYDAKEKVVTTTPLCSWFRGDFGGKKGVRELLFREGLIPDTNVKLEYADYDWTIDLDNYTD